MRYLKAGIVLISLPELNAVRASIAQVLQSVMCPVRARVTQGILELHAVDGVCGRIEQVLQEHQGEVRITILKMIGLLQAFPFPHLTAVDCHACIVLGLLSVCWRYKSVDCNRELYAVCGPTREQESLEELIKAIGASAQTPPSFSSLGGQGKPGPNWRLLAISHYGEDRSCICDIEALLYMIHLGQNMYLLAA
jgi:hypothetical protein